jgi:hypothetical protein
MDTVFVRAIFVEDSCVQLSSYGGIEDEWACMKWRFSIFAFKASEDFYLIFLYSSIGSNDLLRKGFGELCCLCGCKFRVLVFVYIFVLYFIKFG